MLSPFGVTFRTGPSDCWTCRSTSSRSSSTGPVKTRDLVGQSNVQRGQLLGQPPQMIENQVVAPTENAPYIVVGARIEADAVSGNAAARLLFDCMLGVEHQIPAVVHVDVVRLAIGDEQYQLARGTPL